MSFHNYEKKVNRKTNKIRQSFDDQKKYKMQRKETLPKKNNRFEKQRKKTKIEKPTFSMKKKMIRDNFFSF